MQASVLWASVTHRKGRMVCSTHLCGGGGLALEGCGAAGVALRNELQAAVGLVQWRVELHVPGVAERSERHLVR
jgi:hypothetical protein